MKIILYLLLLVTSVQGFQSDGSSIHNINNHPHPPETPPPFRLLNEFVNNKAQQHTTQSIIDPYYFLEETGGLPFFVEQRQPGKKPLLISLNVQKKVEASVIQGAAAGSFLAEQINNHGVDVACLAAAAGATMAITEGVVGDIVRFAGKVNHQVFSQTISTGKSLFKTYKASRKAVESFQKLSWAIDKSMNQIKAKESLPTPLLDQWGSRLQDSLQGGCDRLFDYGKSLMNQTPLAYSSNTTLGDTLTESFYDFTSDLFRDGIVTGVPAQVVATAGLSVTSAALSEGVDLPIAAMLGLGSAYLSIKPGIAGEMARSTASWLIDATELVTDIRKNLNEKDSQYTDLAVQESVDQASFFASLVDEIVINEGSIKAREVEEDFLRPNPLHNDTIEVELEYADEVEDVISNEIDSIFHSSSFHHDKIKENFVSILNKAIESHHDHEKEQERLRRQILERRLTLEDQTGSITDDSRVSVTKNQMTNYASKTDDPLKEGVQRALLSRRLLNDKVDRESFATESTESSLLNLVNTVISQDIVEEEPESIFTYEAETSFEVCKDVVSCPSVEATNAQLKFENSSMYSADVLIDSIADAVFEDNFHLCTGEPGGRHRDVKKTTGASIFVMNMMRSTIEDVPERIREKSSRALTSPSMGSDSISCHSIESNSPYSIDSTHFSSKSLGSEQTCRKLLKRRFYSERLLHRSERDRRQERLSRALLTRRIQNEDDCYLVLSHVENDCSERPTCFASQSEKLLRTLLALRMIFEAKESEERKGIASEGLHRSLLGERLRVAQLSRERNLLLSERRREMVRRTLLAARLSRERQEIEERKELTSEAFHRVLLDERLRVDRKSRELDLLLSEKRQEMMLRTLLAARLSQERREIEAEYLKSREIAEESFHRSLLRERFDMESTDRERQLRLQIASEDQKRLDREREREESLRKRREAFARALFERRVRDEYFENQKREAVFTTSQNKRELQVDRASIGQMRDVFNLPRSPKKKEQTRHAYQKPASSSSVPEVEPKRKVNLGSLHLAHQLREDIEPVVERKKAMSRKSSSKSTDELSNAPVTNNRLPDSKARPEIAAVTEGMSEMAKRLFNHEYDRIKNSQITLANQVQEDRTQKETRAPDSVTTELIQENLQVERPPIVPVKKTQDGDSRAENESQGSESDVKEQAICVDHSSDTVGLSDTAKRLFEFEYARTMAEKSSTAKELDDTESLHDKALDGQSCTETKILEELSLCKEELQQDNRPTFGMRSSKASFVDSSIVRAKGDFGLRRSSSMQKDSRAPPNPSPRSDSRQSETVVILSKTTARSDAPQTETIVTLPMTSKSSGPVYSFRMGEGRKGWMRALLTTLESLSVFRNI